LAYPASLGDWFRLTRVQIAVLHLFGLISALRTGASEEGLYQRYLAFASLQLVTSLAVGRTIANVNPPAAFPQITGADT
jgi:hypothetical protein